LFNSYVVVVVFALLAAFKQLGSLYR